MTGTDVARFTDKQSRSYLNHLVYQALCRRLVFVWDVGTPLYKHEDKVCPRIGHEGP